MFRNYLAAALRNLARNRIISVLNILGLSLGVASALLIALLVRHWMTFERWIPGHERIYHVATTLELPGRAAEKFNTASPDVGRWLRENIREGQAIRLMESEHVFRHNDMEANEPVYWADPETFAVLELPVIAGDLREALHRPEGIVLNESAARRYFGRTDIVGQTLELDRQHTTTVTAVIADLPSNTQLNTRASFGSGLATFSPLARADAAPTGPTKPWSARIYVRLSSAANVNAFQQTLASFPSDLVKPLTVGVSALPIAERRNSEPSVRIVLVTFTLLGVLVLLIPCINFINLMTARATRRSLEVGVRKAAGARTLDLLAQFMGEALIYVLLSTLLAIAIVETVLPYLNAYFNTTIEFSYWSEPSVAGLLLGLVLVTAALAGIYPSLVLSAFRPASVLKNRQAQSPGRSILRESLVSTQFAILIVLMLAAAVIYQQTVYATTEAIRFETDQVLLVRTPCRSAFKDEVAALPGVVSVACSNTEPVSDTRAIASLTTREGQSVSMVRQSVGPGFFELYGVKPVAGRTFSKDRPEDMRSHRVEGRFPIPIVINESAARKLGYASAAEAVGKEPFDFTIPSIPDELRPYAHIIGVVPDLPVGTVENEMQAIFYLNDPETFGFLNVKLRGREVPETLEAIDRLWKQTGEPRPIQRFFLQDHIERFYTSLKRQSTMFAIFAIVTAGIACMGLLGLADFAAERRTKEIGIRKAMGADRSHIVRMLLWQFTRPVLWSNLIAWPIAYFAMSQWLDGFAYRIDLQPWMFALVSVIAVLIAWVTVAGHAFVVASAMPVYALRDE